MLKPLMPVLHTEQIFPDKKYTAANRGSMKLQKTSTMKKGRDMLYHILNGTNAVLSSVYDNPIDTTSATVNHSPRQVECLCFWNIAWRIKFSGQPNKSMLVQETMRSHGRVSMVNKNLKVENNFILFLTKTKDGWISPEASESMAWLEVNGLR